MNEIIEERKVYRVMVDKTTKTWAKCNLLTNGNSVDCADGMTVEQKIGDMVGMSTIKRPTPGYAMDASVAELAPLELTAVLAVGQTTKSWTSAKIDDRCIIQIYTDVDGVKPISKVQSGSTFTVVFPQQNVDVNIIVHVYSR